MKQTQTLSTTQLNSEPLVYRMIVCYHLKKITPCSSQSTHTPKNFFQALTQNVIPDFNFDLRNQSEDCLFLNIFTPANNSKLLPVMVFIHGGKSRKIGPIKFDCKKWKTTIRVFRVWCRLSISISWISTFFKWNSNGRRDSQLPSRVPRVLVS